MEAVDLTIVARQKIGLTGANGSGKSSLLACCAASFTPMPVRWRSGRDCASRTWRRRRLRRLRQAIEYVLDGDRELRQVERELRASASSGTMPTRSPTCMPSTSSATAYTARARAAQILDGLGFAARRPERPGPSFRAAGACA